MTEENPFDQFNTDEPLVTKPAVDEGNPFNQYNSDAPLESSALKSAARSAIGGVIPATTGIATAGAGAELGLAAAPFLGPAAPLGPVIGALGGMFVGSMIGEGVKDYAVAPLVSEDVKKKFGFTEEQRYVDEATHPYASQIGGLVPYLVTSSPYGAVKTAAKAETALGRFLQDWKTQKAVGGGLMGAWELGQEALSGDVDWTKVAVASAFGVIFNHQNRIGQRLHNVGAEPVNRYFNPPVPPPPPSRSMGGALFSPREMPDMGNPTLRELEASGVMGPGTDHETYTGIKSRPPLEELFSYKRLEEEYDALYGPQRTPVAEYSYLSKQRDGLETELNTLLTENNPRNEDKVLDIQKRIDGLTDRMFNSFQPEQLNKTARRLEPELFAERDALIEQRDGLEKTIEMYRRPSFEQYDELRGERSALEATLAETKNKKEQRQIRTQIRSLTGEIDGMWSRMQGDQEGMVDEALTGLHTELSEVNRKIRDQGRDISRAHRMAAETLGAGDMMMDTTAIEGAVVPADTAAQGESTTPFDLNADKERIYNDAKRELLGAGRPEDEADAGAKMAASRYVTRASAFRGARGTPYQLYLENHAKVTAWDRGPTTPPAAPAAAAGGEAATATVRAAEANLAETRVSVISEPGTLPEATTAQEAGAAMPPAEAGRLPVVDAAVEPTAAPAAPVVAAMPAPEPVGPKVGDAITLNGVKYQISALDEKNVSLTPTRKKDNASALNMPRSALEQMLGEFIAPKAQVEGEKISIGGETLDAKLSEIIRSKLEEQGASRTENAPGRLPDTPDMAAMREKMRQEAMSDEYPVATQEVGSQNADLPTKPASAAEERPFNSWENDSPDPLLDYSVLSGRQYVVQEPQTLLGFIRMLGGVQDVGGTLKSQDINRVLPGLMNKKGMPADKAREAAVEQGYLPEDSTPDDLFNALMSGEPVYRAKDEAQAQQYHRQQEGRRQEERYKSAVEYLDAEYPGHHPDIIADAAMRMTYDGMESLDALEAAADAVSIEVPEYREAFPEIGNIGEAFDEWISNASPKTEGNRSAQTRGEEPAGRREGQSGASGDANGAAGEGAFTYEAGAEGKQQAVVPGAEQITQKKLAERLAGQPMRGGNEAAGGMFDEGATSRQLFDSAPAAKAPAAPPAKPALTADGVIASLERIGTKEAHNFMTGAKARLEKGPPLQEDELAFWNRKVEEFAARVKDAGKPVAEHYNLSTILTGKERDLYETQLARDSGEIKGLVERADALIERLVERVNNAGFKVRDVNAANAEDKPQVRDDRGQISSIAGTIARLLNGNAKAGRGKQTAQKNERVAADIAATHKFLNEVEAHLSKPAEKSSAPTPKGADDALYQRGGRNKEKRALGKFIRSLKEIWLKPNANPTTIIHEHGHEYLEQMVEDAAHDAAPQWMRDDFETVKGWLNWKPHQKDFTASQHEKFARGFERYLYDGVAPTRELASVFRRFADWMKEVYRTVAGLNTPEAIPQNIKEVFDRLLSPEPHQFTIASEGTGPRTIHDVHEAEARSIPTPDKARPLADRAHAEAWRTVTELPNEVKDELSAAAERTGARQPLSGIGASEGRTGGMADGSGRSTVINDGGASRTTDGAKLGGRSEAENAGSGETGAFGGDAGDDFFARGGTFTDKAGNIIVTNITNEAGLIAAVKEVAAGHDGFMDARRGIMPDVVVNHLAEQIGLDGMEETVQRWTEGQAFNAENVMALRLVFRDSARDLWTAAKNLAAAGSDWKAARDYAVAKERHIMMQRVLSGVTAEAGRALRAFRDISGDIKGKDLEKLIRQNTGDTLYQLLDEAKVIAALDSELAVHRQSRHMGTSFGEMVLEYGTNNLISNPVSHVIYTNSNILQTIFRAVVETPLRAVISNAKVAAGKDIAAEDVTRFGEVWQQILGAKEGFGPAVKAAGQSFDVGLTARMPRETMKNLPGIRPGQEAVQAPTVDQNYSAREIIPDMFAVMRGATEGLMAYGKMLALGVDGEPFLRLARNPLYKIPDVKLRGVTVPVGTSVNVFSRGVSSLHAFNRTMFYFMELNAEAFRKASAELETGKISADQFERRLADLKVNPDGLMIDRATGMATEQTQMAPGGEITRRLTQFINTPIGAKYGPPLLRFIEPFVHISSNVVGGAVLKRTPLGFFSEPVRNDLMGKNGHLAQNNAVARMVAGTGLLLTFTTLKAVGMATGGGPKDPADAAIWKQAGYQPYSVNINGTWVPYHRLGVLGLLMGMGADLYSVVEHVSQAASNYTKDELEKFDEEINSAMGAVLESISHNILEENFMRGPAELTKAVEGGEGSFSRYIRNFMSSMFVPGSSMMGQTAHLIDPVSRRAQTLVESLQAKIPFLSENLYPRRDIWGEPIMAQTSITTSTTSTDPVRQEVYRLGVRKAPVEKRIRGVELTGQQYDDYQRIAGRMSKMQLDLMVSSPSWQMKPDAIRKLEIEKTIDAQRSAASNLMLLKYKQIPHDALLAKRARVGQ